MGGNPSAETVGYLKLNNLYIKSNSCGFSVIPACPESFFKKDSRRASLAGMTNDCKGIFLFGQQSVQ